MHEAGEAAPPGSASVAPLPPPGAGEGLGQVCIDDEERVEGEVLLPSEEVCAKALPSPEEQAFLLHLRSVYDSVRGEGARASAEGYVSGLGHRVVGSLAGT